MTTKHFDAVIAKNRIAEFLRDAKPGEITYGDLSNIGFQLREIEIYIGEGNQPSISDIISGESEL